MATSFQFAIPEKSRRSARFIRKVHREIQRAFSEASKKGMTQQKLATMLDINRATINKRLLGQDNLTLRSIAELAWALDNDIEFSLRPRDGHRGNGVATGSAAPPMVSAGYGSISAAQAPVSSTILSL